MDSDNKIILIPKLYNRLRKDFQDGEEVIKLKCKNCSYIRYMPKIFAQFIVEGFKSNYQCPKCNGRYPMKIEEIDTLPLLHFDEIQKMLYKEYVKYCKENKLPHPVIQDLKRVFSGILYPFSIFWLVLLMFLSRSRKR